MPLEMLLEDFLVVAHVLSLGHDVAHELADQLLRSIVDFVNEQLAANFDPLERGKLERMALVAPNESLVWRALQ